jgi:hypothetical protein
MVPRWKTARFRKHEVFVMTEFAFVHAQQGVLLSSAVGLGRLQDRSILYQFVVLIAKTRESRFIAYLSPQLRWTS